VTETHHELAVIPRAPRNGDAQAPLSFAQERLFLLDRIMPGLPVYSVPRLLKVTDHLLMQTVDGDIEALSAEVEAVGEPRQ
jgi:hypothetical protein